MGATGGCGGVSPADNDYRLPGPLPYLQLAYIGAQPPAAQTITFNALADHPDTDAPFTVSATATSGLTISYSASGQCSLSGNTVTLNGTLGTCTITASQAGNAAFAAATSVSQTFNITAGEVSTTNSTVSGSASTVTADATSSGPSPRRSRTRTARR
jgi:hypothetical protein